MAYAMTKQGSLDNCVTYEFICDTVEDMNAIENRYRTIGTVAIVLQGASGLEVYIAGSDRQWNSLSSVGGSAASDTAGLSIYICAQNEVSEGVPDVELPDEQTLYLVPAADPDSGNLYDEYIYVENEWEKFGSGGSAIDLSAYATKANPVFSGSISLGRVSESTIGANSVAEGNNVVASGGHSHAEGASTTASGDDSHAEGNNTTASGRYSHAEGYYNIARGENSHAEGYSGSSNNTISFTAYNNFTSTAGSNGRTTGTSLTMQQGATGNGAHKEGYSTSADGSGAHAEGYESFISCNYGGHVEGYQNYYSGSYGGHAEGYRTYAGGNSAQHAEGYYTYASGNSGQHAEGVYSVALGSDGQHAEGYQTYATGNTGQHAEGCYTKAAGNQGAHSEGAYTESTGTASHSEGYESKASGDYSHAEGYHSYATSSYSHAEGYYTNATGNYSHSEGSNTVANKAGAHAEGYGTTAGGTYSHAEGNMTKAAGNGGSHAEGEGSLSATYTINGTTYTGSGAYGVSSHTEGSNTWAMGHCSHAEGHSNKVNGDYAHAEGYSTQAKTACSHAEGESTIAAGYASHVVGAYNVEDSAITFPEWVANTSYAVDDKVKITTTANNVTTIEGYVCKTANSDSAFTSSHWYKTFKYNYIEIVGNGNSNTRSNARVLDWDGNEHLKGDIYVGCNADSTGGTKLPRIPSAPVADGDYILKVSVSSGTPTYSWVAVSSLSGVTF